MDSEKQRDEITALESIYKKEEFSYHKENELYQCNFEIFIDLPTEYYFTYSDNRHPEEPAKKVQIFHLPPLSLYITLPKDYPSTSSPNFMLCTSWLCQLSLAKLRKQLDDLWVENKGQEILFVWFGFLQHETLRFLSIEKCLSINCIYTAYKIVLEKAQSSQKYKEEYKVKETVARNTYNTCNRNELQRECYIGENQKNLYARVFSDCPSGRNPIQFLIDYNEECNKIEFNKSLHLCTICFADKLGKHCIQFLPCSHVFCKDCISSYLEVKIEDGSVQNISCPEQKCTSEATPGQVKDVVSPEMFDKYDSILLNVTLDTMSDIVYCPRRHCQYPVSRDPNEDMATCPVCQYAFCVYCKMVYHGIEPCKVNSAERKQLINEYQAASNSTKLRMEKKYGKKQLEMMVENAMSESWIDLNSHHCPRCNAAIVKSKGCNKMTCLKCKTVFCWLCGGKLNPQAPYLHFRTPGTKCFDMLYYGEPPNEDDEEEPIEFAEMYLDYFDIDGFVDVYEF